ncbi:uncharacterized protein PpBr36_05790 [Pyricularia pennisetigena]|uniref:uncharacterized protein n=1 Tax=Pyricularia pennisetigena TaxID=1578925 RepID=UPI00114D7FBC|nr:uncharacterized protein PpBr36_05790 [Pyricularia pennisetigena]TLS22857.1 hypothetical protein PpBr36_05790 [Pyricularia pennisetigena]
MPDIRTLENREMVNNFIESGERLNDKLRRLLKHCKGRMLNYKKIKGKLYTNTGPRFVDILLERDYELNTEKFMSSKWDIGRANGQPEVFSIEVIKLAVVASHTDKRYETLWE